MPREELQEAFDILNISVSADVAEIKEAYRKVSSQNHPDVSDGDEELQKTVNKARDIAVEFVRKKEEIHTLVKQSVDEELAKQYKSQKYGRRAEDSVDKIKHRRTRPLHTAKYVAIAIAALSGLLGWFGNDLTSIFMSEASETVAKLIASVMSICAILAQIIVARVKYSVQSLKERLNDLTNCAEELSKLLRYQDRDIIDESDIFRWSRRGLNQEETFTNIFGLTSTPPYERARLVLLKSVEHGILVPQEPDEIDPESKTTYKVDFSPSNFRP